MSAGYPIEKAAEPFLGVLMLDTRFPRIPGDIGNPETFDFPVRRTVVKGAFPDQVIRTDPVRLLPDFIAAARQLETDGAAMLSTSCGFLNLFQKELQGAVSIPVLTSSLFMYQDIAASLPSGKRPGILTIAKSSLAAAHLEAAAIPFSVPIGTTENGMEFSDAILENRMDMNIDLARMDNVTAALDLVNTHPDIGAILLECTNMPPYAGDIGIATGLPVYSIVDGLVKLWGQRHDQG